MAGRETVQQTGGVGDIVVFQLTVHPAWVSQDVLLSADPGGGGEGHTSRQLNLEAALGHVFVGVEEEGGHVGGRCDWARNCGATGLGE